MRLVWSILLLGLVFRAMDTSSSSSPTLPATGFTPPQESSASLDLTTSSSSGRPQRNTSRSRTQSAPYRRLGAPAQAVANTGNDSSVTGWHMTSVSSSDNSTAETRSTPQSSQVFMSRQDIHNSRTLNLEQRNLAVFQQDIQDNRILNLEQRQHNMVVLNDPTVIAEAAQAVITAQTQTVQAQAHAVLTEQVAAQELSRTRELANLEFSRMQDRLRELEASNLTLQAQAKAQAAEHARALATAQAKTQALLEAKRLQEQAHALARQQAAQQQAAQKQATAAATTFAAAAEQLSLKQK